MQDVNREVARPLQRFDPWGQFSAARDAIKPADPDIDRMDRAPAEQGEQVVADFLTRARVAAPSP